MEKSDNLSLKHLSMLMLLRQIKSDLRCANILSVIGAQKSFFDYPHLNDQTTRSTVILGFKQFTVENLCPQNFFLNLLVIKTNKIFPCFIPEP